MGKGSSKVQCRVHYWPAWPWFDHLEPRNRPGTVVGYISHRFAAKLHQEENDVTAADVFWLVAIGKFLHRVGLIRGRLPRGLTIRSPELVLGLFFAILDNTFEDKLHKEGNDVTAGDGNWLVALGKGSLCVVSIRCPKKETMLQQR